MSSSAGRRNAKTHILDFFYDDENSAALTVLENNVWFHIIADSKHFERDTGRLGGEYLELVEALRERDQKEQAAEEARNKKTTSGSASSDNDSGIDVSAAKTESTALRKGGFLLDSSEDVQQELQNWMLKPFGAMFEELSPPNPQSKSSSLADWYRRTTHFFELKPNKNDELDATEIEEDDELKQKMTKLMPTIEIPKYIQNMDIPKFYTKDLTVIGEAAEPEPFHPSIVETTDGQVYFLKVVDKAQPAPTKREIKLLTKIDQLGLREKFNIPQLLGLVYPDEKKRNQIIGFLQTNVSKPVPLVKLLDEDVAQRQRDKWAKEVERITGLLHDNDIIFGDMKADNFLVDENDELWIIDFGGSFTEGWVDPEFMETEEGDDMGAEKIVNALHDPANYAEDEQAWANQPPQQISQDKKRKMDEVEDETSEGRDDRTQSDQVDTKKQKTDNEPKYCICNGPESGRMVACDNDQCELGWFHFDCVGLKESPDKSEKWFCDDCRASQ